MIGVPSKLLGLTIVLTATNFAVLHEAKVDYWAEILRQIGKEPSVAGTTIRSHCGRNRYDGRYFGWRSVLKRVVGGEISRKAEWPWLVSLQLKPVSRNQVTKRIPDDLFDLDKIDINDYESLEKLQYALTQLKLRLKEMSPEEYQEQNGMDDAFNIRPPEKLEGHTCGGALISPYWILTAKHCFEKKWNPYLTASPDRWIAVLGEHHLKEHELHEAIYDVVKIIRFPDDDFAKREGIRNDIAMVKLARPAKLDEYVQLACLPYLDEKFEDGLMCSVAGWGVTTENGNISAVPQHISIPLVNQAVCQQSYSKLSHRTPRVSLEPSMLCAGGDDGKDACQYDSGGPLLCRSNQDNQWIVTGIVSYGVSCASVYPGIYTRVSYFIDWIKKVIQEE